jgi:uncharacterized protein
MSSCIMLHYSSAFFKDSFMQHAALIIVFLLSWLLMRFFEKGTRDLLGLMPTGNRMQYCFLFFTVTALCCAGGFWMRMYFAKEQYALAPNLDAGAILTGTGLVLESVLLEELLFRGVGLYILVKKFGSKWGIFLTALVFGISHWMNSGVWGNPAQMAMLFAYTFSFGLVLGYAFTKTGSLLIPIAIHFGWNMVQNFIFPQGPVKNSLLILVAQPEVTVSYFVYITLFTLPKIAAIVLNFLLLKKLPHTIASNAM